MTDWWERFVYLRVRDPILVNSNYFGLDSYNWSPTDKQIARAANIAVNFIHFKVRVGLRYLTPNLILANIYRTYLIKKGYHHS